MARVIQIEFKGEDGQFQATAQRIIERTKQMNSAAVAGAQQATSAFTTLTAKISGLPSVLGSIAGSMGLAFGVGSIIAFSKRIVDAAGQIDDLSKRTGFARQTLSGLKSAIEENGGNLASFAVAVTPDVPSFT